MIINLKNEPKEVGEWVRQAEKATGLSGSALIAGAIMDFSRKAKEHKLPRQEAEKILAKEENQKKTTNNKNKYAVFRHTRNNQPPERY